MDDPALSSATSVQGRRAISLTEWIALSAFLRDRQAAEGRREGSRSDFVGRAAAVALLVVDGLRKGQSSRDSSDSPPSPSGDESIDVDESCIVGALRAEDVAAENFTIEIFADSDVEELKNSPELLLAALESVIKIQIVDSIRRNDSVKDARSLPKIFRNLGLIFYQLFSGGKVPPPGATINNDDGGSNRQADEQTADEDSEKSRIRAGLDYIAEDEEHPGAEKGRQKRFIGDTCKILRSVHVTDLGELLSELCVPASITILLKDFIEREDDNEYAFQSLEDVNAELRQIVSRPDVFLCHDEDAGQTGALDFGEGIVGRTEELTCLVEAASQVEMAGDDPSHPHTLVLIRGDAGSGKSRLVESLRDPLMERGWTFLSCKFDRLMQGQSLSTIALAFEEFFRNVASLANEGQDVGAVLSSVQDNLSASGIVVLSELIPSLYALYPAVFASLVRDDYSDSSEDDIISSGDNNNEDSPMDDEEIMASAETRKNRLHYLFRRLVHAISRSEHPLFLWVDDLQWVDESGIELLSSLLTDSDHLNNNNENSQRLLIVSSFRDGEIDGSHILMSYLERFNSSASVSVHDIHLDALTESDVNALISEVLRLPVRQTRALADVVYAKTLGNPLYLQLFMKSLIDEKFLNYDLIRKYWTWDIKAVNASSIDDNVAAILARKLRRLPEDSQDALKITSCFGTHVEECSFRVLLAWDEKLMPCLERARQEGILERDGLSFAHDTIQQAAYDLMSPAERGQCHYTIGFQLVKHISSSNETHHFHPVTFCAVGQINMAKSLAITEGLFCDQLKQIEFASLNLKAGERSIELSDFPSALMYLQYGISFLPETRWETNYGLSLRLYESACLACYINARSGEVTEFLKEILENARSFEDKLNGFFVLIRSLNSSGKLKEAMGKIFLILDELGESFPESDDTQAEIQEAFMSAKSSLDGYSKDDLISSPRLNNKRKHWAVKLMGYASLTSFLVKPSHLPLLGCRIVSMSIKYGVSSEFAFGLSTYAFCQINILRDIEEGNRWGKICLSLLDSLGAKDIIPKMKILCYYTIFFWVEPLQSIASVLLQCHSEASMVGDIEYALYGASTYCEQSILCGSFLPTLEKECSSISSKAVNQLVSCLHHLSNHQSVIRLIGSKKNPFDVWEGLVDDEDELLNQALSAGKLLLSQTVYFNRLFVAFFLKRYDEAAEYAAKYPDQQPSSLKGVCHTFYQGLTALHFARRSSNDESDKWFTIGEKALMSFRKWSKHSTWNWENKSLLLEAEWHFSKGEMERAEEKYVLSIESARRHRFVHEEGLANELFSVFHITNVYVEKGKSHILEARTCYEKWGAFALVELLDST